LLTDIFSSVLVENSRFEKNSAGSNGGALYLYEGSYAMVNNSSFVNNSAKLNGGVIAVVNGSQGYMNDCSLEGNSLEKLYKGDANSSITVGQ
jgi:predicted outer membrane repeat protein